MKIVGPVTEINLMGFEELKMFTSPKWIPCKSFQQC